jgi:hypothetical protein
MAAMAEKTTTMICRQVWWTMTVKAVEKLGVTHTDVKLGNLR